MKRRHRQVLAKPVLDLVGPDLLMRIQSPLIAQPLEAQKGASDHWIAPPIQRADKSHKHGGTRSNGMVDLW